VVGGLGAAGGCARIAPAARLCGRRPCARNLASNEGGGAAVECMHHSRASSAAMRLRRLACSSTMRVASSTSVEAASPAMKEAMRASVRQELLADQFEQRLRCRKVRLREMQRGRIERSLGAAVAHREQLATRRLHLEW
jgi:hypothetical protein